MQVIGHPASRELFMQRKHGRGKSSKSGKHLDAGGASAQADDWRVPPDGLPVYRLFTGQDDAAFCQRVSEALALGYELYGSPSVTFNGTLVIVAQAVVWRSHVPYVPGNYDEIPF